MLIPLSRNNASQAQLPIQSTSTTPYLLSHVLIPCQIQVDENSKSKDHSRSNAQLVKRKLKEIPRHSTPNMSSPQLSSPTKLYPCKNYQPDFRAQARISRTTSLNQFPEGFSLRPRREAQLRSMLVQSPFACILSPRNLASPHTHTHTSHVR